jgi:hypothetical protein
MGYYDSVKDDIKNKSSSDKAESGGNFDTLKKNASEETEQEEDDTPIEVLDEGLDNQRRRKKKSSEKNTDSSSGGSGFPPASNEKSVSADTSGLEEKLDKIIEQNARMIEILESFGN